MCAVSQMVDYGMRQPHNWLDDPIVKEQFQKLISAARKFDIETNQEDCPSAEKEQWLEEKGLLRCGDYKEWWKYLDKPEGWLGCSLKPNHEGNHSG